MQYATWIDPGVNAADIRDGDITSSVIISGSVDVNVTGTYILTYSVSIGIGNEAQSITRTVNVLASSLLPSFKNNRA